MVNPKSVRPGEVWLARLDPPVVSETRKTRPCVVISPPEMHDVLRTVIVAPMTTRNQPAPFRIPLRFSGKDGLILLDQMRAIDKLRLIKRLGAVTAATLKTTLAALAETFAE